MLDPPSQNNADIHTNKGEPTMFEGLWCGIKGRAEAVYVGTKQGVIQRRTVRRLRTDTSWDAKLAHEMEGITWQPAPGHTFDHMPVGINDDSTPSHRDG